MNADINGQVNNTEKMESLFKFFLILYLTLTSISLILLSISDVRPLSYYAIVTAISTVILLQILLFETTTKKALLILAQIMFMGLNLIWGGTLKYYYYIGRTDLMGHTWDAQQLLQLGHVTDIFGLYQAFPLWHILNVSIYLLAGLNIPMNDMLNIACGLIYFVMPPAVFVLAMKLLNDRKVSVLASLITAISPMVLTYGTYSISRSVASFLLVALLVVLMQRGHHKTSFLVAMFFTLSIISYHTVSIVFVLAILALIYILQILFVPDKSRRFVSGWYLMAGIAMTIVYWAILSNAMIGVVITNLTVAAPQGVLTKGVYSAPLSELFNYLQYMPYLLFTIVGAILVMRSKKYNDVTKLFGLTGLLMIPLTFPGPALLLNKLASNLSIDRFEEYAFIFIALAAAIGFFVLYSRANKLMRTALILLFVCWVILSVSNDFVSSDNPLVKRLFYTSYLEQSEVDSINHLATINAGFLMSDYVTERYLEFSPYALAALTLEIDDTNRTFLSDGNNNLMVIREDELARRPLKLYEIDSDSYTTDTSLSQSNYIDSSDPVFSSVARYDKVYDSKSVDAYV